MRQRLGLLVLVVALLAVPVSGAPGTPSRDRVSNSWTHTISQILEGLLGRVGAISEVKAVGEAEPHEPAGDLTSLPEEIHPPESEVGPIADPDG